ncbi:aldo/keto reductase [Ectothiorhodospiraceae bacterium WFHF3C12]|nr:aldo/keto reductase [Ectothiorhodospiraceae bacterium WFHF3C12]
MSRSNSLAPSLSRRAFLRAGALGTAAMILAPWPLGWAGDGIRRRAIPGTGESIPVIGLGTWQTFDAPASGEQAARLERVLRRFFELGGRVVDSSPMYGRSESTIGALAERLGITDELFFATKVWTRGREAGVDQMQRSAERFRTGVVDLMQVHNLLDVETHLRTLRRMKDEGAVRYIGITHYTVGAHDDLMRLIRREPLDFVQFNYNIGERAAEDDLLPLAEERGVATLINEPFESGALFRAVRGEALPGWAAEFDCQTWAQFFLKYIVGHPAVTCAIPATSDPEHVTDNTRAGFGRLPDERQRRRMAAYFDAL